MARASDEVGLGDGSPRYEIAGSLTTFVEMNLTQQVWNLWHQVNNKIKHSGMVTNRHNYYYISNWDFLANPEHSLREAQALGKNA